MTHSIIIHSTDPNSYNAILPVIYSPESVYTVAGISQDAPTLLRLIDEMNPSVLIIDCTLTESGCFDLIRQVRASYGYELQILAMGARDFDSVYQAIQAGANHYLLFPIQKKELLSCLSTLCIARERILRKNTASRNFYLADNNTDILRDHPLTLRQLNLTYGTNFVEGLFQMLFVKFDFPNSFERLNPENTPVFLHLNEFITNYFKEDCAYIIYEIKKDGIIFLLNYRQDIQTSVNLKINKIFDQIANMIHTLRSMDITICVSSSVNDPCKIWEIKKQVREAEWSRMYYGVNKLIFWTPTTREVQLQAEEKLKPIIENIGRAISGLNIQKFKFHTNELFSNSPALLTSPAARTMIRQVVSQFFQTYWNTIAEFTDPTICYDDVSYCLHLCISFDQYRSTLVAQCSDLMQQISKQSDQKTSPAIQKVITYVKNNIDKPISLDDAAQAVELSSGYLSMLFKKEMNTSFTKYVNAQKNMVACNLLKTSNLNISEIADRIGISDVRAFSKKFHIMNDTTPSAYRKLHHTEKGHVL